MQKLLIKEDFIPKGRGNRPGYALKAEYITIHDTGNKAKTADAANHANYLIGDTAAKKPVSWHFTVDDKQIIQHLPISENGWAAGDGSNGTGNRKSIQIEICENEGGNRVAAEANAAKLVAYLLEVTGLPISTVVQHNKWSGKNCPQSFRSKTGGWSGFLKLVEVEQKKNDPLPQEQPPVKVVEGFMDIAGHWAEAAIVKAKKAGIMYGITEDRFGPDQPITRAQMAVLFDRLGMLELGKEVK